MAQNTDLTPGTCPQCSGRAVQNVVYRDATGARVLLPVECGLCGGTGRIDMAPRMNLPQPPAPPAPAPAAAAVPTELWLVAAPLALFILFFVFLWL
jgi:hypothetical protein